MHPASRLSWVLAQRQHDQLQGARARLLRRAGIARRECALEIGCGWGLAAAEMSARCPGSVLAIDLDPECIAHAQTQFDGLAQVANACQLPFDEESFDLVFAQFSFLWIEDMRSALTEATRVLRPGGALAIIEPDYGGMLEHPADLGLGTLWVDAIRNAGGHPFAGRTLAAWSKQLGMSTDILLSDRWEPFQADSLDYLRPLVEDEQIAALQESIRNRNALVHLPIVMICGEKP